MLDPKPDVQPDPSPGTDTPAPEPEVQPDVNTPQEPSPEQSPEAPQPTETPSTQEVKPEVEPRPVENIAWEAKRKVDELLPKVDKILENMQQNQGQPQQPQYTKPQLLAYAQGTDTTVEQRLWAYGEVDKLDKTERMSEYNKIMQ